MAHARSPRPRRRERRATARAVARAAGASGSAGSAEAPPLRDEGIATARPGATARRDAPALLGLALLVWGCYLPALSGGFVWDDVIFSEEPVIHRWSGLWSIWLSPADIRNEGHYWPLVYTTFWLEHRLWGLAPLGYHVVNVALHLANVVLVWRLALALGVPGAWGLAALFAVHPLHVESVAWIIERKDLLSALFYLGAVTVWVRFTEAPSRRRYGAALGLYAAGLLSKSIVVTLPAALLVWHWWKDGRVSGRDALRLAPFFAVGLAITGADLAFYTSREPLDLGYSPAERMLIAARALWFYAGKLLWPSDLAVIYPLWEIDSADLFGWACVAAAAGLAALLWGLRHRLGRGPLAGAAFFAVTLSPVLGFVDYGYMQFSFVADRFQYLAGIGVMAVLVGGAARGAERLRGAPRIAAAGAFVAVLAGLGTLTWRHCGVYHDEIALFGHIVRHNPEARDAHLNLGSALAEAGRLEEAHAASLVAVAQRPDAAGAHANLGHSRLLMGRFEEAEESLARALALDPRDRPAQQNMGELRRKQGRYEEAVEWFRKVLARDDGNALAHAGLGVSLLDLERHEEALASMDRALALAPDAPTLRSLHVFTGRALLALGRPEEAERRLRRAAQILPGDAAPLVELSRLHLAEQRFDEADATLRRAMEIAPDDTAAMQSMAETLRKQGHYARAVESYRAVLAVDPEHAMAHAGMGDALFRLERHEEAIASLERSLALHALPPTATARLVLMGTASAKLGRPAEAAAHYERAVAIDPRDAEALDHLAMTRFGESRFDEALGLYRTLLEVKPDSAQTHANLAATLYHLGRPEEALAGFERALSLDPHLESARAGAQQLREHLRGRSE